MGCIYKLITSFFFPAEDSIRNWSVTGIQTFALPIWISDCCGLKSSDKSFFLANSAYLPKPRKYQLFETQEAIQLNTNVNSKKR